MILLEVHNRIIEELLTLQIEAYLRKEKLVELKTDVVGKSSNEFLHSRKNTRLNSRFRWCYVSCHKFT